MSNIHNHLKELRIEKGLTQEQVAEKLFLTRQAISAYESGKRQPSIDILMKLAQVYEVDVETILYGKREIIEKKRIKYVAVAVVILFSLLQVLTGLFSTLAFTLYPLKTGYIPHEQYEIVEKHFEMAIASEHIERISAVVLSLGTAFIIALDLSQKNTFSWKRKVGFYLISLSISWLIAILCGVIHPEYALLDFVIRGPIYFILPTIVLIIDLIISKLVKNKNST